RSCTHQRYKKSTNWRYQNHVAGVAVPLLKNGMVIASIGIYLPDIRFGTEERAFIINRVKAAADQINALLNNHK
ncbi:MAG: hypothetical protein SPF72_09525, partial [Parabacteroides sp.]|nr:hypothetical protein [Parabacteroides sp.]